MGPTSRDAKLRFLEASAQFYSSTSPSTSAYIMRKCLEEAAEIDENVLKRLSKLTCAGCATLMIAGWSSRTAAKQVAPRETPVGSHAKNRRRGALNGGQKHLRTQCLTCHRYTKASPRMSKTETSIRESVVNRVHKGSTGTAMGSALPSNTAASRSQRKKARKQGGLRALLEESKQTRTTAVVFGLNLMDIMEQD